MGYYKQGGECDPDSLRQARAHEAQAMYPTVSDFSGRLRDFMDCHEFSNLALAEWLDIHRNTVSDWRAGISAPNFHQLVKLADRTGVSLDWLVLGRGHMDS